MTVVTGRTPPAGLRDRVLGAARTLRAAGRALPDTPAISGTEAFARSAGSLLDLLGALDGEQWQRPVLRDLDVQGLIGHLVGVERDVQRALAGDPAVAGADHVASTQPVALGQSGRAPAETRRAFRVEVDRTSSAVAAAGDPARIVSVHGLRLPLDALLVVHAFELWTHENDVRRAAGLPPSVPDLPTLRLMTDLAVRLLPHGVARAGAGTAALRVHLVLTGGGGGTWDVTVGDVVPRDVAGDGADGGAEVREVVIVTDAVDFCRLAAARLHPAELELHASGATDRVAEVLAGARALALD